MIVTEINWNAAAPEHADIAKRLRNAMKAVKAHHAGTRTMNRGNLNAAMNDIEILAEEVKYIPGLLTALSEPIYTWDV